jgi:hypothetical protein
MINNLKSIGIFVIISCHLNLMIYVLHIFMDVTTIFCLLCIAIFILFRKYIFTEIKKIIMDLCYIFFIYNEAKLVSFLNRYVKTFLNEKITQLEHSEYKLISLFFRGLKLIIIFLCIFYTSLRKNAGKAEISNTLLYVNCVHSIIMLIYFLATTIQGVSLFSYGSYLVLTLIIGINWTNYDILGEQFELFATANKNCQFIQDYFFVVNKLKNNQLFLIGRPVRYVGTWAGLPFLGGGFGGKSGLTPGGRGNITIAVVGGLFWLYNEHKQRQHEASQMDKQHQHEASLKDKDHQHEEKRWAYEASQMDKHNENV